MTTMKHLLALVTAGALLGCAGRVSLGEHDDDDATLVGDAGSHDASSSPTTSPRRTLEEFRAALAGVWEGNLTSDRTDDHGGMSLPAERVRIELKDTGQFIGTCLEPWKFSLPDECSAISMMPDKPSPYRTWSIDRLTAGYEGMGSIIDRTNPDWSPQVLLHRVRLSADGQRLEFSVLQREDDDSPIHYWLTRVAR